MYSATPTQKQTRLTNWILCLAWFTLAIGPAPGQDPVKILFDFDEPLGQDWTAAKAIKAQAGTLEASTPKEELAPPSGRAVHVATTGEGGLYTKQGRIDNDWLATAELSVWFYRSPEEARQRPETTVEWQLIEADDKARFWRKITLDHTGWKRYSARLSHFRWGKGRVPRWDRVARLGFWFRNAGDVWIDNVAITHGNTPRAAELSVGELKALAFPGEDANRVRVTERDKVRVITDAPDLDGEKLINHLENVSASLSQRVQSGLPSRPVTLLVFSTQQSYLRFPTSLAKTLNSEVAPPTAAGFTIMGLATSSWDREQGTLRPVYTHEFVHAWMTEAVGLDNGNEWFQEGLASLVQQAYAPQPNLVSIIEKGMANPGLHTPLKELCNGQKIPLTRYWQAMTVVDLLTSQPEHKEDLPRLLEAFHQSGTTDLALHAQTVFGISLEEIEKQWAQYVRSQWLSGPQ